MDVALKFYDNFPVKHLQGYCIILSRGKGEYTLGRSPQGGAVLYDIDVPMGIFPRGQAVLTFRYDSLGFWTVVDAGRNADGDIINYPYGAMVNGEPIGRTGAGYPDACPIDPHGNRRILIGGHPDMRILVQATCDETLALVDPFEDEYWGDDKWKLKPLDKPAQARTQGSVTLNDDATAALDLDSISNPALKTFIAVSTATGAGLANKQTRLSTGLSILVGIALTIWAAVVVLIVKMDPTGLADIFFNASPEAEVNETTD